MSTSFLVIQAQRDLAQARTNELGAVLSYVLSLVDFESLQEAGPAGQSGNGAAAQASSAAALATSISPTAAAAIAASPAPAQTASNLLGRP